jgi:hypothetical protein
MTVVTTGTAPTGSLEERLAANLVADNARIAGRDGAACAVCLRTVRPGERVADLAGARGLVHVARCSASPAAAPPAPRRPSRRPVPRVASHGRIAP